MTATSGIAISTEPMYIGEYQRSSVTAKCGGLPSHARLQQWTSEARGHALKRRDFASSSPCCRLQFRQRHDKRRPHTDLAFDANSAAVHLNGLLGDVQPQAGASDRADIRRTMKWFE